MKIGIFSDVHGNVRAFEKVWKQLKDEVCDRYFFLGDICGYYYGQNEIIEILRDVGNLACLLGNHDRIFLDILAGSYPEEKYIREYGRSLSLLKDTITSENLQFLKSLEESLILEDYSIAMFHGSPWDKLNEYIYPTDDLDRFSGLPYKFILLGHTHYPMDKSVNGVRILNPGSCGQPRDYWQPSYVLWNHETGDVQFKRVEYDTTLLIQELRRNSERNQYLFDILKRDNR
jgi:putative phosphoesterase